ncbi:MAG TPA: hypothetical protein VFB82_15095, partial [Blastocatellia bacterium]|nr:hypothetical protein [Blastocatellia bacterium]
MKENPDVTRGLFVALVLVVAAVLGPGVSISRAGQHDGDGAQKRAPQSSKSFRVTGGPEAIAFDGDSIWVASRMSNTVTRLRAKDGAELGKFDVGQRPVALAYDGRNIWVANLLENSVMKLRGTDGAVLGTFRVGKEPIALLFDGSSVWVVNSRSNSVTRLRASDGASVATVPVGSRPM